MNAGDDDYAIHLVSCRGLFLVDAEPDTVFAMVRMYSADYGLAFTERAPARAHFLRLTSPLHLALASPLLAHEIEVDQTQLNAGQPLDIGAWHRVVDDGSYYASVQPPLLYADYRARVPMRPLPKRWADAVNGVGIDQRLLLALPSFKTVEALVSLHSGKSKQQVYPRRPAVLPAVEQNGQWAGYRLKTAAVLRYLAAELPAHASALIGLPDQLLLAMAAYDDTGGDEPDRYLVDRCLERLGLDSPAIAAYVRARPVRLGPAVVNAMVARDRTPVQGRGRFTVIRAVRLYGLSFHELDRAGAFMRLPAKILVRPPFGLLVPSFSPATALLAPLQEALSSGRVRIHALTLAEALDPLRRRYLAVEEEALAGKHDAWCAVLGRPSDTYSPHARHLVVHRAHELSCERLAQILASATVESVSLVGTTALPMVTSTSASRMASALRELTPARLVDQPDFAFDARPVGLVRARLADAIHLGRLALGQQVPPPAARPLHTWAGTGRGFHLSHKDVSVDLFHLLASPDDSPPCVTAAARSLDDLMRVYTSRILPPTMSQYTDSD